MAIEKTRCEITKRLCSSNPNNCWKTLNEIGLTPQTCLGEVEIQAQYKKVEKRPETDYKIAVSA